MKGDDDPAFGHGTTYLYYGATFARRFTARGLPGGNAARTVEGFVRFNRNVRIARWGGFAVGASTKAS